MSKCWEKIFSLCNKWIKAYHFSDNDGLSDTNGSINSSSWFIKYFNRNLDYYSLEIYKEPIDEIIKQLKYLNTLIY